MALCFHYKVSCEVKELSVLSTVSPRTAQIRSSIGVVVRSANPAFQVCDHRQENYGGHYNVAAFCCGQSQHSVPMLEDSYWNKVGGETLEEALNATAGHLPL